MEQKFILISHGNNDLYYINKNVKKWTIISEDYKTIRMKRNDY